MFKVYYNYKPYLDNYKNHQALKSIFPGTGKVLFQRNGMKLTVISDITPVVQDAALEYCGELNHFLNEKSGKTNLFSLRLNACKRHQGKRITLSSSELDSFLNKKLSGLGMNILAKNIICEGVHISERAGKKCFHNSVLVNGMMKISSMDIFRKSITQGVGHGKAFGFGMINIFF